MIKDQIENALANNQGFALWSEPGSDDIQLIFDEKQGDEKFVLFPFDVNNEVAFEYSSNTKINISEKDLSSISYHNNSQFIDETSLKSMYKKDFDFFVNELKSESDVEKLVLAHAITKKMTISPFEYYLHLHTNNKAQFVYLFYTGKQTFWMAATPETLVREEGQVVKTMALAGTKIPDEDGNLHWTGKEFEEHQLVVDYIADEFSNLGLSLSYPKKPIEISAGYVWHLQTPMQCKLNGLNVLHLANHLHPTPAVCGTPKEKAKAFIIENEHINREYYCGFVGPMSNQKSHLFVNLRCAKVTNNTLTVYVGGGLLKNSDLESEWEETMNKSKTILSVL